jgi:RimJ/RimL family protein N-acetyltransferase
VPDTRLPLPLLLSRAANRVRTRGAAEVTGLLVRRLVEGVVSDDEILMYTREAGGDFAIRSDLTFRAATEDDASRYAKDIGTDSVRSFRSRLSAATRCFVVERDELLVHSTWATTAAAWTRELRRYIKPPPGDAYVHESYTRPEVRGQGVYPFALTNICATLGPEGIRRVWVAVEGDNPASIRAVTKAGFEPAWRLPYRRRVGVLRFGQPTGPHAGNALDFVSASP